MCTPSEVVGFVFDEYMNDLYESIGGWSNETMNLDLKKRFYNFVEEFCFVKSDIEATKHFTSLSEADLNPLVEKVLSLTQRFREFVEPKDLSRYGLV